MNKNEKTAAEIEKKYQQQDKRKRAKMRVSGAGVKKLQSILKKNN